MRTKECKKHIRQWEEGIFECIGPVPSRQERKLKSILLQALLVFRMDQVGCILDAGLPMVGWDHIRLSTCCNATTESAGRLC